MSSAIWRTRSLSCRELATYVLTCLLAACLLASCLPACQRSMKMDAPQHYSKSVTVSCMDHLPCRWLTALEPDNEPETESTINGTYAYPAAESEATAMHLGDQLLCEPAPSSGEGLANLSNVDPLVAPAALVSVGQQEASGSTGDGLLATALAMPEPSTSGDSTSAACPQMPMQKNTTTPSECKSPVVSPCLSPSAASSMPDGIEYLDLNDGEMEKWPGVDPESRYQSALDYPVV